MNAWAILDGFGAERSVWVHPSFVRLFGVSTAILLSEFLRIQKTCKDDWFQVTAEILTRNTGLSAGQQKTAREHLIRDGVVHEMRSGLPCKLRYRLDVSRLVIVLDFSGDKQ